MYYLYYSEFGNNLRNLRKSRNLTQKELGTQFGLSKAVVSKYESSLGYPTFDVLVNIASFFGVTTDFLLGVSNGKTIDVSALTDSQVTLIQHTISEFVKANQK